MKIYCKGKKGNAKKSGRPEKRVVGSIPDTPENVAKALFGIKPTGEKNPSKK